MSSGGSQSEKGMAGDAFVDLPGGRRVIGKSGNRSSVDALKFSIVGRYCSRQRGKLERVLARNLGRGGGVKMETVEMWQNKVMWLKDVTSV